MGKNFIGDKNLVVGAAVVLNKLDIEKGKYKALGIGLGEDGLRMGEKILPGARAGRYSKYNRHGRTIVMKDLPKEKKSFSFDAPNYGDWYNGSHVVEWEKEVYQRQHSVPRKITISSSFLEDRDGEVVVGFLADGVLNRNNPSFNDDLLYRLNLLQENVGSVDIFGEGEPIKPRMAVKRVNWEILPPGWWADTKRIDFLRQKLGDKRVDILIERSKFIESLNPQNVYIGQSYLGGRTYVVYDFGNHVVAESPNWGNAVYVLSGEQAKHWQAILSESKREALNKGAGRILHIGDWKAKLAKTLSIDGKVVRQDG